MPLEYTIDKQQRPVFVTVTGEIEVMDIDRLGRRLREDPDFDPSFNLLLDLQGLVPPRFFYSDLHHRL